MSKLLEPGSIVEGRYKIVGFLGAGGFATVYRAQQLHVDRMVALKLLTHHSQSSAGDEFERRFEQEARLAAKIDHPNVVTIYEFGFAGEGRQPFIAMELLEGQDLSKALKESSPLDPARVLRLFRGALEAVGEGHKIGIVHKDLKPSNLYLTRMGEARESMRVLDFGVARAEGEGAAMTSTGQLMGTPMYLPPEYIRSQIATPALDVYQMALILVEMLTGKPVVEATSPFAALLVHAQGEVQIPRSLLTGRLGAIVHKALHPDYEQRYRDCNELYAALEPITAADLVVGEEMMRLADYQANGVFELPEETAAPKPAEALAEASGLRPLPLSAVSDEELGEPEQVEGKPAGRKHGVIIVALLLLLGLGGLLIFVATQGPSEPGSEKPEGESKPLAQDAPQALADASATAQLDLTQASDVATAGASELSGSALALDVSAEQTQREAAPDQASADAGTLEQPSAPEPALVQIFVDSSPSRAEIYHDDKRLGLTPTTLSFPAGSELRLLFKRSNYKDRVHELRVEPDMRLEVKLERQVRSGPNVELPVDPKPVNPLLIAE